MNKDESTYLVTVMPLRSHSAKTATYLVAAASAAEARQRAHDYLPTRRRGDQIVATEIRLDTPVRLA